MKKGVITAVKTEFFLGKEVDVVMDRSYGTRHPKHGFLYEENYGYVPQTLSGDGEELDAYFLGEHVPLVQARGVCIAYIRRKNDDDDKLIVVPEGVTLSDEDIRKRTHFQEQWFVSDIARG